MRMADFYQLCDDVGSHSYKADPARCSLSESDKRPVFRLRDVNRLKKLRAWQKLKDRKHRDFVAMMYGTSDYGEGEIHRDMAPLPLEPKFNLLDAPKMPEAFDDDLVDNLDDSATDFPDDEIEEIE